MAKKKRPDLAFQFGDWMFRVSKAGLPPMEMLRRLDEQLLTMFPDGLPGSPEEMENWTLRAAGRFRLRVVQAYGPDAEDRVNDLLALFARALPDYAHSLQETASA